MWNLIIVMTLIIGLMVGCVKKDSVESDPQQNEYLSFQSEGCSSLNRLSKSDDDAILQWSYLNNTLRLDLIFSTHCSAAMKDSVLVSDNAVTIFLSDTNTVGSECTCSHDEVFNFRVRGNRAIRILFNYKPYSKTEYYLLTDKTIQIN